jgi:fermentation-respiration switch protein FrsA (DUF1100 family)
MMKRLLQSVLAVAALFYAAVCGYMAWNQRSFLYRPMPEQPVAAQSGLPGVEETILAAQDGTRIVAWQIAPRGKGRPVYVYFHGNAGNLSRRASRFRLMTEDGSGLFAIHYRGYGGSGGSPSEAALHADAELAWAEARRVYPDRRIVIFGESLGSGVATRLASVRPDTAALVLDSPFSSILSMAQAAYPWLPVSLLLVDAFRSDLAIGNVRAPVFIMHGGRDRIVPIEEGRRLFSRANEPKRFVEYPEARHIDGFRFGAMEAIRSFLTETAGFPGS